MKPATLSLATQGETPFRPINNQLELAIALRELCGAEGYRIDGQTVIAVRWDEAGNEILIDEFTLTTV